MTLRTLLALFLCAALAACASDTPEPAPAPAPTPTHTTTQPKASPAPARPKRRRPARPKPKSTTRAKRPTATVRITGGTFGSDVRRFRKGDLVEVQLARNRYLRGWLEKLTRGLLTMQQEPRPRSGRKRIRLKPGQVRELTLLYRPVLPARKDPTRGPPTAEESWLEQHAPDMIVGKHPLVLWNTRFLHNVPLLVRRPLTINGLRIVDRKHRRTYFGTGSLPQSLYAGDEVKVLGATPGYQHAPRGVPEPSLGRVYLYLVKRADTIWPVSSLDRLHPSDLNPESVNRYLKHEPVTLVVRRPGEPPILIARRKASELRAYRKRLDAIPEPQAMRRLRARNDASVAKAEAEIRKIYALFELEEVALEHRISVRFELPAAIEGNLRMLRYEREIGLD
ncbi:MAG: hypothetical protein JKY65_31210 [Planctomycetes bacterium]|nr:hypothetical protein [Planctomycetota bacterium]